MIEIANLREEDKVGSKYIDKPLKAYQGLKFGVMKDIKSYTENEIFLKLLEEVKELENCTSFKNKVEEIFDVCQVGFTWLKFLEKKGLIVIDEANVVHINKLDKRGYIE